jgi:hypothetical protein
MRHFYVYGHYKPDSMFPFYIGKGTKNRAYEKHQRNEHWVNTVNKYGYRVEIMYDNLTEDEAHFLEKELIKHLGRANIGCGTLVNITEGGEGVIGYKHTDETKKIISMKNKKWVRTPEYCKKISELRMGKKRSPFSEQARKNMSEAHRGEKNHRYGKTLSAEVRAKISEGRKKQMQLKKNINSGNI